MGFGQHKAKKGLIRVYTLVSKEGIEEAEISGDFFMYPEDMIWELERRLVGVSLERGEILDRIRRFYEETLITTPGVKPEDFVDALMKSIANPMEESCEVAESSQDGDRTD